MKRAFESWFDSADSRFGTWETQDQDPNAGSFQRLWRAFMTGRIVIASMLLMLQAFIYAWGNINNSWSIAVCTAYFFATLGILLITGPTQPGSRFDAQWASAIGVDVAVFSALHFLQSGSINYTPLFALPVLMASVLGPILLALGTAASVTLLLLADAWWISIATDADSTSRFLQSGLSGSGFFLVALLANQLALRLVREEQRAKTSQSQVRMQTQVNELVVETLSDGVLVIDSDGIVRSANPASRRLLEISDPNYLVPFALTTDSAWQPLADVMHQTFRLKLAQAADVSLEQFGRSARSLHVRTRLAASYNTSHDSLCVMFLEDLREMEARVRTEKMAAMGRMSAAVAHEIRNPLAAISQANALLEEDLHNPAHLQLTAMVGQNAQRLAKIVDDILNISRVQAPSLQHQDTIVLDATVLHVASGWAQQVGATHLIRIVPGAGSAAVACDPEHLRRVMINLLDNALRYASQRAGAIDVSTNTPVPGQVQLRVWSDGQPLEKTVQAHLFEPFFSSESRSSGLGLYICRELCERYGALIGYQRAMRHDTEGNEFFVLFKPADQPVDGRAAAELFHVKHHASI